MTLFRILLTAIFAVVAIYTIPVVLDHGITLFPVFFGDIAKMGWAGQFNVDFLGFLVLSACWTALRNRFSITGLGLSLLAFFLGAPFLTAYLLILSVRCNGNIEAMLLGEQRANA
ncbi:MAG: hypothetical protein AB8B93_17645 [Pseudomonadales bacterium]